MYSKKPRFRLWPVLTVILAAAVLIGSAVGKYIYSTQLTATVKFSAKLADSMVLEEHEVVRNADGSYETTSVILPVKDAEGNVTDNKNEYVLIPGLDVPKDPYISIVGKTPLDSYLFLEVVDGLNSASSGITYTLKSHWVKINAEAQHGGTVYVYSADGVNPTVVTDKTAGLDMIGIIQDNTVYVSQKLDKTVNDISLNFYAAMGEIAVKNDGTTPRSPAEVYRDTY